MTLLLLLCILFVVGGVTFAALMVYVAISAVSKWEGRP